MSAVVERARRLVGCRFRPQGRSGDSGLDCVGLVLAAYALPARAARRDYRLRGDHRAELQAALGEYFCQRRGAVELGDLLLCKPAEDQIHLCIWGGASFIHADAGIGRIVETPGRPQWPVIATYRRRARRQSKD